MSGNNNENDCAICFEPLCSSISPIGVVNPCGHVFHKACYEQWENTNKQRQRNSIREDRRNAVVKCPTCNTKSKGFIGMYLNLGSCNVDNRSDCIINDLKRKYTEKEEEIITIYQEVQNVINKRCNDRLTIEQLEKKVSEKEEKIRSIRSKRDGLKKKISEKEDKIRFIRSKHDGWMTQCKEMEKELLLRTNRMRMVLLNRKKGKDKISSTSNSRSACKRRKKRALEEETGSTEENFSKAFAKRRKVPGRETTMRSTERKETIRQKYVRRIIEQQVTNVRYEEEDFGCTRKENIN